MGLRDSVAPISSWFLGRFAVDLSKVSLGRLLRKTRTNRFSTELLYEFNQEIGTGLGNRVADDIGPAGAPRGIADEISKHIYDDADLTISLPRSTTLVCRHRDTESTLRRPDFVDGSSPRLRRACGGHAPRCYRRPPRNGSSPRVHRAWGDPAVPQCCATCGQCSRNSRYGTMTIV